MLKTKSILSPKDILDGLRISIMSRHTLEDGIVPDTRISSDSYDEWRKEFAPPQKLIGDYYKRRLSWSKFEKKYIDYLKSIYEGVENLAKSALTKNITLLCVEDTPEKCHRRLLAERCLKINPKLKVIIN